MLKDHLYMSFDHYFKGILCFVEVCYLIVAAVTVIIASCAKRVVSSEIHFCNPESLYDRSSKITYIFGDYFRICSMVYLTRNIRKCKPVNDNLACDENVAIIMASNVTTSVYDHDLQDMETDVSAQ